MHLQVMDHTGSTSFIVFDRNVSTYVGKSVQDLIDAKVYDCLFLTVYQDVYHDSVSCRTYFLCTLI